MRKSPTVARSIVKWRNIEALLMEHYEVGASKEGADAFPPVLLMKCMLLQKWFHIPSDPELENQINDRISFKFFEIFKGLVKSFLKLIPFFVNTEAHVKAVYTICILAYFINRCLANQRKSIGERDFLNSKELYAPFRDIDITTLEDSNSGHTLKKVVKLPAITITEALLEKLSLRQVAIDPTK